MNYGEYEIERRLRALRSKSGKYASKMALTIFKALFVLFLFFAVLGASVGFGMVKGIIDNAPSVDLLNIQHLLIFQVILYQHLSLLHEVLLLYLL